MCMEVSKHCIDEHWIDRSIKPKMKMNDCKWFFHFSCGGFFFFDKYGCGVLEVIFGLSAVKYSKVGRYFRLILFEYFYILCEDRHEGMALFVCIMYEVGVFFFFFISTQLILIEYWAEQQMWLINWKTRVAQRLRHG